MSTILKEKEGADVENLKAQLAEFASSLQYALDTNTTLVSENKYLVVVLARMKLDNDALLTHCLSAEEKERIMSVENEELKQNLTDLTVHSHSEQEKIEQLQAFLRKEGEDLRRTQDFVLHQHELGFNKALDQAAYLYNIPLNEWKFDVNKDFYKGELMLVIDILDDDGGEEFAQSATPGLDNAVGKA